MSPYLYVKRALLAIGIIVCALFLVRPWLVPASFGQYGAYRGAHLEEERAYEPVHAGGRVCADCHEENSELKDKGRHASVPCETCHFQPYAGKDRPGAHPEVATAPDRSRAACTVCHEFLPSRPAKFPQVKDFDAHIGGAWSKLEDKGLGALNLGAQCITCHNPHRPKIIAGKA